MQAILGWLIENKATIIVLAILIAVLTFAAFSILRDRKKGKGGCSCGCAGCVWKDQCHKK